MSLVSALAKALLPRHEAAAPLFTEMEVERTRLISVWALRARLNNNYGSFRDAVPFVTGPDGALGIPIDALDAWIITGGEKRARAEEAAAPLPVLQAALRSLLADEAAVEAARVGPHSRLRKAMAAIADADALQSEIATKQEVHQSLTTELYRGGDVSRADVDKSFAALTHLRDKARAAQATANEAKAAIDALENDCLIVDAHQARFNERRKDLHWALRRNGVAAHLLQQSKSRLQEAFDLYAASGIAARHANELADQVAVLTGDYSRPYSMPEQSGRPAVVAGFLPILEMILRTTIVNFQVDGFSDVGIAHIKTAPEKAKLLFERRLAEVMQAASAPANEGDAQ